MKHNYHSPVSSATVMCDGHLFMLIAPREEFVTFKDKPFAERERIVNITVRQGELYLGVDSLFVRQEAAHEAITLLAKELQNA